MNRYNMISRFARTGSRAVAIAALTLSALAFSANTQAAIAWSTFDNGANDFDGWTGLACINPGVCSLASGPIVLDHFTTGGVGDSGYIEAVDPGEDIAARGLAPAKILNALALNRRVTLFANAVDVDGTGFFASPVAPLMTIEYGAGGSGATLVYGTDNLPDEVGTWNFYDFIVAPDGAPGGVGWQWFSNADPENTRRPAILADFTDVLANKERATFIMEWLQDVAEADTGGLDSVHVVPVPAALPLILSALFGLGFAARRRR